MSETFEDGTGSGVLTKVDSNNQIHAFAVSQTVQGQATDNGNEYNINTGLIAYTGTAESSLIYLYNDEDSDLIITDVAIGMGTRSATVSDFSLITFIRNPDAGDIISDGTAVAINQNTNFGSSRTLKSTTLVYKGKNGGTVSGGNDHAIFYAADGRLFASLNLVLPKGSSIGLKLDLNTSGGANVYCAFRLYVKDSGND